MFPYLWSVVHRLAGTQMPLTRKLDRPASTLSRRSRRRFRGQPHHSPRLPARRRLHATRSSLCCSVTCPKVAGTAVCGSHSSTCHKDHQARRQGGVVLRRYIDPIVSSGVGVDLAGKPAALLHPALRHAFAWQRVATQHRLTSSIGSRTEPQV